MYNLLVTLGQGILPIAALFSPKIRRFVTGRKAVFKTLSSQLDPSKKTIWMHAASLGEYEQGVPVLEAVRSRYPEHQIVLSFFSPSGYDVRKNTPLADSVVYLPIDSLRNAMQFIKVLKPSLAIFVKYEVWPNYMTALQQAEIPSILIAAIFRPNHIYFKWYGRFMRKSLHKFSHIFVQDSSSQALVNDSGYGQVSVAGDTRFDRVSRLSEQSEALPKEIQGILTAFSSEKPLFVGGSVWPEDMSILGVALEKTAHNIKFVLAPHKVDKSSLETLLQVLPIQLQKQSVWLSQTNPQEASEASVLIVDRIGILNQVYPLAQMAYVGGGFKTGLHNTLEAAVYGIPLAIGPNFNKFKEAKDLVALGGIQVINTTENATQFLELAVEKPYIEQIKGIQTSYISSQLGATSKIMSQLAKYF